MHKSRTEAFKGALLLALLVTSLITFSVCTSNSKIAVAPKAREILRSSGDLTLTTYPTADAYVQEGYPDTNYGTEPKIIARSRDYPGTGGYGQMRGFLKFDISSIPAGATITEAKLRIHAYYLTDYIKNVSDVQIRQVTDDSWSENSIDWNNQPAYGSVLSNIILWDNDNWAGNHPIDNWYENDVTSFVENQFENGDTTISLMIRCMQEYYDNLSYKGSYFNSKEAALENRPTLIVTYEPPLERGVEVSISPSSQSGLPGATLTYTVTVFNNENVSDNFNLTVGDDENWSPTLDNNIFDNIAPGDSRVTTLRVHILDIAIPGTIENITITAISQTDNTLTRSDSCIAQVTIVRGVQVVITPSSQENESGGTLAYTVTVNNTGNVQENFQITNGDNLSWGLILDNTWLWVREGGTETTKLTVNIPTNATGCTWDNIWVKATSQDNTAVYDKESCLAHVKIVTGVSVSISPSSQSGANNTTLTYTITVSNTGNISDNYLLTDNDNAGWLPSVSPTFRVVAAFSSDNTITLSVPIPSGAVVGTIDNITVTASSQADNTLSGSANCTASAVAETFSLHLLAGWNFVGIPVVGENTTPANVFPGLTYLTDYVIFWYKVGMGYQLQILNTPFNDNTGYWIWINTTRVVSTSGVRPASHDVILTKGWNLVSFPVAKENTTPANVFPGLTYLTDYVIFWYKVGMGYQLQILNTPFNDNTGYWIWINTTKTVTIP